MSTHNKYEYVVVGSGFGGTITALTLANKLEEEKNVNFNNKADGSQTRKVCILERGQWWISPEIPINEKGTTDHKGTIHQYLKENNIPFDYFPYDNFNGFLKALENSRLVDSVKGLYDYRLMQNIHIIAGSGVGGGSLVYFNVTERPDPQIYKDWPTENDGHLSLSEYFHIAESFLGINTITTTAGLGRYKLPKSKVFQEAANFLKFNNIINSRHDNGEINFDAKLSISNIDYYSFAYEKGHLTDPTLEDKEGKYSNETNVCERQGRCGLGCIADSRHSLDKKIYQAIINGKPIEIFPLCEVSSIEEISSADPEYRYVINYKDNSDGKNSQLKIMHAKSIILAAGTLGSTEILLRSKKLELSIKKIGSNFSTNGDIFGIISHTKEIVDASRGPTITSIARFIDNDVNAGPAKFYSIEDIGIPKMFAEIIAIMSDLVVLNQQGFRLLTFQKLIQSLKDLIHNYQTRHQLSKLVQSFDIEGFNNLTTKLSEILIALSRRQFVSPSETVNNILILFGMGQDNDPPGQLFLDNNSSLKAKYNINQPIYEKMIKTMKIFAKEIGTKGEDSVVIPLWDTMNRIQVSAHPLGGCPMGSNSNDGVVNSIGQVFKGNNDSVYDGLYVVDGSIIPSPLGVNPSLTISALAFRIAEKIAGHKKYWPK